MFLRFEFYIFLTVLLCVHYLIPIKYRWVALLAGSQAFYLGVCGGGYRIFAVTIAVSYLGGIVLEKLRGRKTGKIVWGGVICSAVIPLLVFKTGLLPAVGAGGLAAPLGISFYTLQTVSYLTDVLCGRIAPQKNFFKYALFLSWFPQIVQGPIPRYGQLEGQLYGGHAFDETEFSKGLQLIVWGFFLKLVIADKAAIFVNAVFADAGYYAGGYIFVAAVLYSIQLYADFQACVCIAQGASALFGVRLEDNFRHPYMAESVKDFWRRWHISLSSWLRDYVYIPLGGSRRGRLRKYVNLTITFAVSGLWHGTGLQYLAWGMLHAGYQIAGEVTKPLRDGFFLRIKASEQSLLRKAARRITTFCCVTFAWIFFRAESLAEGVRLVRLMITVHKPWIFWNNSLYELGLSIKEFSVLALGIALMAAVSLAQEKLCVRDWILRQHILVRWPIYVAAIMFIVIFGTYGYGIAQQNFIYGGF